MMVPYGGIKMFNFGLQFIINDSKTYNENRENVVVNFMFIVNIRDHLQTWCHGNIAKFLCTWMDSLCGQMVMWYEADGLITSDL